jgi:hypothetical protein
MTITIDSTNPRSVAALGLMLEAGQWAKTHLKDGQKFYGVPSRSRPGLIHLTDTQTCTCEDHTARGVECAHILAVRLHVARVQARRPVRRRHAPAAVKAASKKYEEMYPDD